jgi:uncharacterized protein (DUF1697 family)
MIQGQANMEDGYGHDRILVDFGPAVGGYHYDMRSYVALIRAVNVGGTGKLPMTVLSAMCRDAGFERVKTYIASGNVVFASSASPPKVRAELEARLLAYAAKPISVVVRDAAEMHAILKKNPYRTAASNLTYVFFLNERPPKDTLHSAVGRKDEEITLGEREIYVHYPVGMGQSKLRIPAAALGTARNMNTVAKLADMVAAL